MVRSRRRPDREAVEAVAVEREDGRHPDPLVGDVGEVGRVGLEGELDRLAQERRAEEEPLERADLLVGKAVAEAELAPALGDGREEGRGRGGLLVPGAEPVEERVGAPGELRVVRLDRPRRQLGADGGVVFRVVPGEPGEELEDVAERLLRHRGERARHRLAVGVEAPAKGGEPFLAEVRAADRGDALFRQERQARVEERREDRPGVHERVVEEENSIRLAADPCVGVPREGLEPAPEQLGRPPVSLPEERLGARDCLERLLGRSEERRDREAVERRELGGRERLRRRAGVSLRHLVARRQEDLRRGGRERSLPPVLHREERRELGVPEPEERLPGEEPEVDPPAGAAVHEAADAELLSAGARRDGHAPPAAPVDELPPSRTRSPSRRPRSRKSQRGTSTFSPPPARVTTRLR